MLLSFPLVANDDKVIEMMDFLESYEFLDDEDFDNMIAEDDSQIPTGEKDE